MDVSRPSRHLDPSDSKENKQAGRVVCASVENPPKLLILWMLAERVGFEPTLPFRVNTLSKRAPSATRPSLRRKPGKDDSFPKAIAPCWLEFTPTWLHSFYGQ